MPDQAHLATLGRLGVYASVQPVFDALWGGTNGMYATRLGAERAGRMNPYAAMAAAGIPLVLGSDSPVTPLGPWEAVRAAAFHQTPESRLSVRAAFSAHTRAGWQATGDDASGVLAPGAPATYAVWRAAGLPDLTPGTPVPDCLRTALRGTAIFTQEGALC